MPSSSPITEAPASVSNIAVHKFGGSALATADAIHHITQLITELQGTPTVVTTSAMATVTNTLFDIAASAGAGDNETSVARLDALRQYTNVTWNEVCGKQQLPLEFEALFAQAHRILHSASNARALTPRALDTLVALGEQLAAHILVGALRKLDIPAQYVDAIGVIHTDGRAGNAIPDLKQTTQAAETQILPLLAAGIIPVIPGFIGQADDGSTVTLGRGGTDLTATTLGAALKAKEVVLWKDVPGFLTADPRMVPDARVIGHLHVREAAELAYYGAKILHPRALIPLRGKSCVVHIRSFKDPAAPGTSISNEMASDPQPVRALSATTGQSLVTVSGNGILGIPGMAARLFGTLQRANISVSVISQASSEYSICLGVPIEHAAVAQAQLADEFAREIVSGEINAIDVRESTATIAIVGLRMAGHPGVAARLFGALGKHGINVIAIAQGSSELNISVVIDAEDSVRAQRAIHDEFQLSKIGGGRATFRNDEHHRADVILFGFGLIGRALANMMVERDVTSKALRIVGVIDRSGYVFEPKGFSQERVHELIAAKQSGRGLGVVEGGTASAANGALQHILAHALINPVVVDVTAEETAPILEYALMHGAHIALANKRPVSGKRAHIEALRVAAAANGRRIVYEATVGAGLPILDTFAKLVEAGDTVQMIEGCPSGTMGYLFGELGRDAPFSGALRSAMDLGYTEPDPRDDLSGIDVARKALILGRLLGFQGEFSDVRVESLVPSDAVSLPLAEFLGNLERYDDAWATRVVAARAQGKVLRYRATATSDAVSVGLVEVPASGVLGALNGTDNQFTFTTARYNTNPLVITGPGAGPAVTAAGVLNDVLKVAGAL